MINEKNIETVKIISKHKTAWTIACFGAIIFFSCCLFPLNIFHLNFSEDWLKYLIFVEVFFLLGMLLAFLHLNQGSILKNYGYIIFAVVLGLGARYLLEYGEISNAYNYTVLNVYLFILGAVMFAGGGYLAFRKTIIKATNVKID